jgi:DNA-3-methyladenine glycosylase
VNERRVLGRAYFSRDTLKVARGLLGKYLVRRSASGRLAGRIIEVEAYVGPEDRASHASRGLTRRTEPMFGPAGFSYVYLVYGMHHCFNVVTQRAGYPAAVLVRAVELDSGFIDGPGRVCRALEIDRELNGIDLTFGRRLWLEDRGGRIGAARVASHPRIGVDYAGDWASRPWRFRVRGY